MQTAHTATVTIMSRFFGSRYQETAATPSTMQVAYNILSEAGLSFLGLGIQPPAASWGGMLSEGRNYLASMPWWGVFPGLALAVTVLGFNLLGDGLRDVLDPRLKVRT